MNAASLDLCKDLYKLSGWGTCEKWFMTNINEPDRVIAIGSPRINQSDREYVHGYRTSTPAYDLGYLLRKLPNTIGDFPSDEWLSLEPIAKDKWAAGYRKGGAYPEVDTWADTPEDAVAKLAIELFKQGVLQREAAS